MFFSFCRLASDGVGGDLTQKEFDIPNTSDSVGYYRIVHVGWRRMASGGDLAQKEFDIPNTSDSVGYYRINP